MTLEKRIMELCLEHGTLRAAALALKTDAGYLSRLWHGEKVNPSAALLKRMGLRKVTTYTRRK